MKIKDVQTANVIRSVYDAIVFVEEVCYLKIQKGL